MNRLENARQDLEANIKNAMLKGKISIANGIHLLTANGRAKSENEVIRVLYELRNIKELTGKN